MSYINFKVLLLIKKKYEEALENFNKFTENIKDVMEDQMIVKFLPKYKGYLFFCLSQYEKSIGEYNKIIQIEPPELYNKTISQAILELNLNNNLEKSIELFEKSSKICPHRMEPFFYMFASNIYFYNKNNKSDYSYVENALKYLEKARKISPNFHGVLYFQSLLSLIFEESSTTVQDMTLAIEGVDEGKAEYYFIRGVAYFDIGMHNQAYSDFSIAISFQNKWSECYYNRAICCQILGDIEGALNDFRSSLAFINQTQNNDLLIANFLFGCGLYEEAIQNYMVIEDLCALIEKVKCLIHMKELNLCLETLDKLIEITDNSEDFVSDKQCLLSLKYASEELGGKEKTEISDKKYIDVINNLIENGKNGMVFKSSDFCFYRAVFYFYNGKYKEAIESFVKAYQIKSVLNEIKYEFENSKNDLLSESAASFTFHEYLYNLIICYLKVPNFLHFSIFNLF